MTEMLVGLDVGTTKLCAVAVEATAGTILAVESTPNAAHRPTGADGAEQDVSAVIDAVLRLLTRLLAHHEVQGRKLGAIGVTGQMHGVAILDSHGTPLTPLISWQDRRGTHSYAASSRSYADELTRRLGADLPQRTGCVPATGYGAVTLLRLQQEGLLPERGTAMTIQDAAVQTLCGKAVTDPTDAASWGIFDSAAGCWLDTLDDALPFLRPLLPAVMPTASTAGTLLPAVASQLGVAAGVPVAVALGDNQASFLGSVPAPRDSILINLGTGGQMSIPIDYFAYQPPLETRPFVAGQWLMVGASLCGGRAYQVLETFFRQVGQALFDQTLDGHLYERLNTLAATADPNCDGLSVSTLFAGSRQDTGACGDITGISTQNLTPANLTRAVLDGMIRELLDFYSVARNAGARASVLCGAGNGVRCNPLVCQILESRLGLPLFLPDHAEEAAVGAALSGGMAAGIFADWGDAARTILRAV